MKSGNIFRLNSIEFVVLSVSKTKNFIRISTTSYNNIINFYLTKLEDCQLVNGYNYYNVCTTSSESPKSFESIKKYNYTHNYMIFKSLKSFKNISNVILQKYFEDLQLNCRYIDGYLVLNDHERNPI